MAADGAALFGVAVFDFMKAGLFAVMAANGVTVLFGGNAETTAHRVR